jgi:glutathione S-transferase
MQFQPNLVLYASQTSPFVRRVKLALRRAGLQFDTRTVENLFPPPDWLLKVNPLGLIPALVWDDEPPLCDSSVILDFIDDRTSTVWPKDLAKKWVEKRFSSICAGMMHDAVCWRIESMRSDARLEELQIRSSRILQTLKWLEAFERDHNRCLVVSKSQQGYSDLCVALDYLCFRMPDLDWASAHPGFLDLLEEAREQESFGETDPRLPVGAN